MSPGERTEPEYAIRVHSDETGTWVLRDEIDDDGELIGTQQLHADGWWSEWHLPAADPWNGDPNSPTQPSALFPWLAKKLTSPPVTAPPPPVTYPVYGGPTWVGAGIPPLTASPPPGTVYTGTGLLSSLSANTTPDSSSISLGSIKQAAASIQLQANSQSASGMSMSPSTADWIQKHVAGA